MINYRNLILKISCLNDEEAEASEVLERYKISLHSTKAESKDGYLEETIKFYPDDM